VNSDTSYVAILIFDLPGVDADPRIQVEGAYGVTDRTGAADGAAWRIENRRPPKRSI
jgi:hypothetical protein